MPDFEKTCLNIKAKDGIDILQAVPASKCRELDNEGNIHFNTFYIFNPFPFYIIPKTFVHLFKSFSKRGIFYGVIIFFGKWPSYRDIAIY